MLAPARLFDKGVCLQRATWRNRTLVEKCHAGSFYDTRSCNRPRLPESISDFGVVLGTL